MNIIPGHKKTSFFLSLLFTLLLTVACSSSSRSQTNVDADGVALKGYDPVAYFTMGNPAKGESQFSYAWNGAVWLFANQEHKDLFAAAPEKYAPQYGGYWAYAVSRGSTADIDPSQWTIVDGKLYLNLNEKVQKMWSENRDDFIKQADSNWPGVLNR